MMTTKESPAGGKTIPLEEFAADLWEALRQELREQLGGSVTEQSFLAQFLPWDQLPADARDDKMTIARDELLKVLDRAGYQVRRKPSP